MQAQKFDVLIVGAGPAGAACAIKLANTGLAVALLDKATFPRDKTCGDALSVDVVNQLAMLSDKLATEFSALAAKVPSYGVKIFAPNHQHVDIPFFHKNQKSCGYICQRLDFDNLLFQHLKEYKNIQVIENCTVEQVLPQADGLLAKTNRGEFTANIIVGADGAHSVVAKHLGPIKVEKDHYSAGLRVYYEGVTSFHDDNYIELHFFKDILPGYLWVFPLPDNKANVGIGVLSEVVSEKKLNLKEVLQKLLQTTPNLQERFKDARPLETVKGYGLPLGSKPRNISGERFLLTGDAASLIDPFSGEGIGNAIRSGRVAAEHILNCFEHQNFSAEFNRAYDKEIYRRMWKELKVSHSLQKLCRYPWLFNFVVKKGNQSKYLKQFLIEALANVEIKRLLTKPGFYYRMLFK
ncbi:geranylgeranyl hydrogenase BchP [Adhaeribacter aerolatus]|uniref:Geranylgeranyl hydrogenase BchP n=1 Tax=Adhaeribacter aerolatus TaxID=670289 RepID=A0A512ASE7_9BACT|nr:geranylgeranyl reductase family protein [Adhaeribacter aerolatus]GEO02636.1 geranylgeranyl hydrogenase BchP [Adhaeribacter aerolatus]